MEIIEVGGEEGIDPRCGHLGSCGGSPLEGRKTVGGEEEIGGNDGGREDCGIAGGSVQGEGRTQATSGLPGRDDHQFVTEVEGATGPLISEVLDGEGEERVVPTEKGADDLRVVCDRVVFEERKVGLVAHLRVHCRVGWRGA
jgi:hypothetical protein